jgi:hypothetical protein
MGCRNRWRRSVTQRATCNARGCVRNGLVSDGRRSGSLQRAAFDGAARVGDPGASSPCGESNPVHREGERDRERQGQGHDPCSGRRSRSTGSAARRAFDQRLIRSWQGWAPRETGDNRGPCRSWRLAVKRGSTRSRSPPRFRPGGRLGSQPHQRKPVGAVIRESSDLWSARGAGRLQMLGRRIFPGRSARREARGAGPGQLDVAVSGDAGCRFAVGERVRGERGRTSKGTRASLLRSQDRRSSQKKALWFWDHHRPKPAMERPGPGRAAVFA